MQINKILTAALLLTGCILSAAEGVFNATENTMDFGSKKLVVQPNGVFRIYSDGREAATVNFYLATHYGRGKSNTSLKSVAKYDGGDICLTEFKADPKPGASFHGGSCRFIRKAKKRRPEYGPRP